MFKNSLQLKRAFNEKGLIQKINAIDEHLKSLAEPMNLRENLILELSRLQLQGIKNAPPDEKTRACRTQPRNLGNGTSQRH